MEDVYPQMFLSSESIRDYFILIGDAISPGLEKVYQSRDIWDLTDQCFLDYKSSLENKHVFKDVQAITFDTEMKEYVDKILEAAYCNQDQFGSYTVFCNRVSYAFVLRERDANEIELVVSLPQVKFRHPKEVSHPEVKIPDNIMVADRILDGSTSATQLSDIEFGTKWTDLEEGKHILMKINFPDADGQELPCKIRVFPNVIGRGKFASVYTAALDDDADSKEPVFAVKKVTISESMNVKTRVKCFNEVRILKILNHPNVVRCYDAFYDKPSKSLILILEMLDGGDLKVLVERIKAEGKKFSERQVWRFLRDLCSALAYMHDKRIMHRDLKPANVLLCNRGYVKVADFGLGRIVEGDASFSVYSKVGTPLYMPPEVTRGESYGAKAEVYGAGCLAWELIVLRPPFTAAKGLSLVQLFELIQNGKITVLTPENCAYSELLCSTVMDMVALDPRARPPMKYISALASKQFDRLTYKKKGRDLPFDLNALQQEYQYFGREKAMANLCPPKKKDHEDDSSRTNPEASDKPIEGEEDENVEDPKPSEGVKNSEYADLEQP